MGVGATLDSGFPSQCQKSWTFLLTFENCQSSLRWEKWEISLNLDCCSSSSVCRSSDGTDVLLFRLLLCAGFFDFSQCAQSLVSLSQVVALLSLCRRHFHSSSIKFQLEGVKKWKQKTKNSRKWRNKAQFKCFSLNLQVCSSLLLALPCHSRLQFFQFFFTKLKSHSFPARRQYTPVWQEREREKKSFHRFHRSRGKSEKLNFSTLSSLHDKLLVTVDGLRWARERKNPPSPTWKLLTFDIVRTTETCLDSAPGEKFVCVVELFGKSS